MRHMRFVAVLFSVFLFALSLPTSVYAFSINYNLFPPSSITKYSFDEIAGVGDSVLENINKGFETAYCFIFHSKCAKEIEYVPTNINDAEKVSEVKKVDDRSNIVYVNNTYPTSYSYTNNTNDDTNKDITDEIKSYIKRLMDRQLDSVTDNFTENDDVGLQLGDLTGIDTSFNSLIVTGSATSTYANGINITAGCFSINGTCVTGGGSSYDDGDVNSYIHASTTVPKTYTTNTFTGANTFNGTLTIGSLTGPLQAQGGVVSATTSVGVTYGGTGITSAPSLGQLLVGNSSNGYALTATSSLGIALSDTRGTLGVAQGGTNNTSFISRNLLWFDGTSITSTSTNLTVGSIISTTTATSTFTGGIQLAALDVTGSATSTFAQGINLATGCFSINGTCSGTVSSGTQGQIAFYNTNGTAVSGTSTLTITSGSKIGVGTTTPWGSFAIGVSTTTHPVFSVGSSTSSYLHIDGFGRTMLGTTTGVARLTVQGDSPGVGTAPPALFVHGGTGGASSGAGGAIVLQAGAGGGGGNGGAVSITAGVSGSSATPGVVTITGGAGLAASGITGGAITIQGGAGGTSSGTGGSGGALNLIGGTGADGSGTDGSGGTVYIAGGTPFAGNSYGNVVIGLTSNGGYFGNVGIATSTPIASLSVKGTSTTRAFLVASSTNSEMFVVSANGNVGIGTSTPYAKLSVNGETVSTYFTSTSTTATSTFAWGVETNLLRVTSSVASSTFANGINLTTGCFAISGICVGGSGGSGTVNSGTQGQVAYYSTNGTVVSGTSTLTIYNQKIGIGTTTPGYALDVYGVTNIRSDQVTGDTLFIVQGGGAEAGNLQEWKNYTGTIQAYMDPSGNFSASGYSANGSGGVSCSDVTVTSTNGIVTACGASDERLKDNVQALDANATLDKIMRLNPVSYVWNDIQKERDASSGTSTQIGFIAQQLQIEFPELVVEHADGYKGIRYAQLTSVLTKGVQELYKMISDIKAKVDDIGNYLADKIVHIKETFTGTLHVEEKLCVDDVCITKDDLKALLISAGGQAVQSEESPEPSATTTEDNSGGGSDDSEDGSDEEETEQPDEVTISEEDAPAEEEPSEESQSDESSSSDDNGSSEESSGDSGSESDSAE